MKSGDIVLVRTTGEVVFVIGLTKEDPFHKESIVRDYTPTVDVSELIPIRVLVKRPIFTENSGIRFAHEFFWIQELETPKEKLGRLGAEYTELLHEKTKAGQLNQALTEEDTDNTGVVN